MLEPVSGTSSRNTYWSFAIAPSEPSSPAARTHCANLMFASAVKTTRSIIGVAYRPDRAVTKNYAPRTCGIMGAAIAPQHARVAPAQSAARNGCSYISLDNGCLSKYSGGTGATH